MQKEISIKKNTLKNQGTEKDINYLTADERVDLVWQLTIDVWLFKGENIAESRLQRNVVNIQRGKS